MSFDALTIAGILSAALAGGFLLLVVSRNDSPLEAPPESSRRTERG